MNQWPMKSKLLFVSRHKCIKLCESEEENEMTSAGDVCVSGEGVREDFEKVRHWVWTRKHVRDCIPRQKGSVFSTVPRAKAGRQRRAEFKWNWYDSNKLV